MKLYSMKKVERDSYIYGIAYIVEFLGIQFRLSPKRVLTWHNNNGGAKYGFKRN